jgi:hypothetical protein
MLIQEAQWLRDQLAKFTVEELSPLLDVGSSTKTFREIDQPYVHNLIFAPLLARGVEVKHVDLKSDEGVDVVGDIFNVADHAKLTALRPRSVICASMLEHVKNPAEALSRCLDVLPSSGLLFLTVPFSFPYHADPIDTMFRPSPEDIAEMARPHRMQQCDIVRGNTLLGEVRLLRSFEKSAASVHPPLWRRLRPQSLLHTLWLFRPYKMTCAVIVK